MTDSVLIVGAGIAGLSAAMEVANAGARALVVERGPVAGGRLAAAMTRPAAIGERAEGESIPLFEMLASDSNIEILTLAELATVEGRPGNFSVTICARARLVTDACTRCGLCRAACPVVLPNEYDAGLTYRKAIYTPMSETLPGAWVIDVENCLNTPPNYLPCQRCVEVCADNAIHFDLPLETRHERQVAAVILAPGFEMVPGTAFEDLGYGAHPDVLVSAELQRLLESPGPTGGYATRPSNEAYPDSVLLVLDTLSSFALYVAASQVHQLLAQEVESVVVLVLSEPGAGSEQAAAAELAKKIGLALRWGAVFRVDPKSSEKSTDKSTHHSTDPLAVSYQDLQSDRFIKECYDLVVLCSDVQPPDRLADLAAAVGVALDDSGYIQTGAGDESGTATSSPGIFVAGCASRPMNIKTAMTTARSAAQGALACVNPALLDDPPGAAATEGAAPQLADDELRARIEQLLYGLIDRPGG